MRELHAGRGRQVRRRSSASRASRGSASSCAEPDEPVHAVRTRAELRRVTDATVSRAASHRSRDVRGATSSAPSSVGHHLRLRLRAARGRARAHVQDVGRLQPRVRRAGVRGRARSTTTCASATTGRSRSRSLVASCSSSRRSLGFILDRLLFRHLRTASPIAQARRHVLGLLVAIPQIVKLWFDVSTRRSGTQGIVPDGVDAVQPVRRRCSSAATTSRPSAMTIVDRASGCSLLFRYTALGLRMRAVVESPRMTELAGVNADRVSTAAWMLSSVARRPRRRAARAAVRAGRRRSTTRRWSSPRSSAAVLAALVEHPDGVPRRPAARHRSAGPRRRTCRPNSILAHEPAAVAAVRRAVPPAARSRRGCATGARSTDPLAGVDPPPPALASRRAQPRSLTMATHVLRRASSAASSSYWLFFHADVVWLARRIAGASIFSMIFLSITVITGMAGQISLCQATFAGIGALRDRRSSRPRSACRVLLAMIVGGVHRGRGRRAARAPGAAARRHLPRRWRRSRSRCSSTTCWCRSTGSVAAASRRSRRRARSIGPIDFVERQVVLRPLPHRARRSSACSGDLRAPRHDRPRTSTRCAAARSRPRRSASTRRGRGSSRSRCRPAIAGRRRRAARDARTRPPTTRRTSSPSSGWSGSSSSCRSARARSKARSRPRSASSSSSASCSNQAPVARQQRCSPGIAHGLSSPQTLGVHPVRLRRVHRTPSTPRAIARVPTSARLARRVSQRPIDSSSTSGRRGTTAARREGRAATASDAARRRRRRGGRSA